MRIEQIDYINNLIQLCLMPQLQYDLDTFDLNHTHFEDYHDAVVSHLPRLFDVLHEDVVNENFGETAEMDRTFANLLVLLCEVTAMNAVYRMNEESVIKSAPQVLQKFPQFKNSNVVQIAYELYLNWLRKDTWKRNVGAVHGFMRFLEFRHNEATKQSCEMSLDELNFCLSVGLILRDCHDPAYKQIGTRIFQLMLTYSNAKLIKEMNIHAVIYESVSKDVSFLDTVSYTADTWNCLHKVIRFYELDSVNWSLCDDLIQILLNKVPLASNALVSICLFKFLTKFGYLLSINEPEIDLLCNNSFYDLEALKCLRDASTSNSSMTILRWAKDILSIILLESDKLLQSANICRQFLQEFHRCYLVYIYPTPTVVSAPHLLPFYEKLIPLLMQTIITQEKDKDVIKLVKCLLETFTLQLENSEPKANIKLMTISHALQDILKNEVFL